VDVKRAADRIGEDIDVLAGTIGERNMWRFAALQRAAAYITERLEAAGFTPAVQEFSVRARGFRTSKPLWPVQPTPRRR
jgi:hypothetical protein